MCKAIGVCISACGLMLCRSTSDHAEFHVVVTGNLCFTLLEQNYRVVLPKIWILKKNQNFEGVKTNIRTPPPSLLHRLLNVYVAEIACSGFVNSFHNFFAADVLTTRAEPTTHAEVFATLRVYHENCQFHNSDHSPQHSLLNVNLIKTKNDVSPCQNFDCIYISWYLEARQYSCS